MAPKPTTDPLANWRAWVDRKCREGGEGAAMAARFLDRANARSPDLKGVSADQRAAWSQRLHAAAGNAGATVTPIRKGA